MHPGGGKWFANDSAVTHVNITLRWICHACAISRKDACCHVEKDKVTARQGRRRSGLFFETARKWSAAPFVVSNRKQDVTLPMTLHWPPSGNLSARRGVTASFVRAAQRARSLWTTCACRGRPKQLDFPSPPTARLAPEQSQRKTCGLAAATRETRGRRYSGRGQRKRPRHSPAAIFGPLETLRMAPNGDAAPFKDLSAPSRF